MKRILIEKKRLNRILGLALPIVGGMVSQNLLSLVDTAMVGTLGNSALAAAGLGGFAFFMCASPILGVFTAVQTVASRRKGENRLGEMSSPLNAGILLVLLSAPLLTALLYWGTPYFYPYINSDPEVISLGIPYLQIRLLGISFMGLNYAFRGYWNAVDLSRIYFSTLVIIQLTNLTLDYLLIFGKFGFPELGVEGAGLATTIALGVGNIVYFYLGFRHARKSGFLKSLPAKKEIQTMIRLSIPSGVQQLFFSAGFVALYWIVGKMGTVELAAINILITVLLVAILPGMGLGIASATLVGQALGRKDVDDAARWGWEVTRIGTLGMILIGLPMWVAPDWITGIFIQDPKTIEVARIPMIFNGLSMFVEAIGLILMQSLLGAGDVTRVTKIAVGTQWLLFLPLAYLMGPILGYGFLVIWLMQGGYRLIQTIAFFVLWKKRAWATIQI